MKNSSNDKLLKNVLKDSIVGYKSNLIAIREEIISYTDKKKQLGENYMDYISASKYVYDICMLYKHDIILENVIVKTIYDIKAKNHIYGLKKILSEAQETHYNNENFIMEIKNQIDYYENRDIFVELYELKIILKRMIERKNNDKLLKEYYTIVTEFINKKETIRHEEINTFINNNFNTEVIQGICNFYFNYNELNNKIQINKRDLNWFFEEYTKSEVESVLELKKMRDCDITIENIDNQITLIDEKIIPFIEEN